MQNTKNSKNIYYNAIKKMEKNIRILIFHPIYFK